MSVTNTLIFQRTFTKAAIGFFAIMLMLGILAACGGDGDSEAEETLPEVPSGEPVISTDSQPGAGEIGQEGDPSGQEPVETTQPESVAPGLPDEEIDPNQEVEASLSTALKELEQVLEDVLNDESEIVPADIAVVVQDGEIIKGETRYEIAVGENIIIEVSSSQFNQEVHVHGYDLTAFAGPVTPARFEFVADLAGTWEVEFEDTHELIFELVVR